MLFSRQFQPALLSAYLIYSTPIYSYGTEIETRSLDEIYQSAKKEEGTLKVYFGGSCMNTPFLLVLSIATKLSVAQAGAEPMLNAFRAQFPDISINITADLSKYADSRIDRSYIEGKPFIDVSILQTVHDFARWDKQQRLLHYKPPNYGDINLAIKHIDGAFLPVNYSNILLHKNEECQNVLTCEFYQINLVPFTMIQPFYWTIKYQRPTPTFWTLFGKASLSLLTQMMTMEFYTYFR
jgi:hypothetical protein